MPPARRPGRGSGPLRASQAQVMATGRAGLQHLPQHRRDAEPGQAGYSCPAAQVSPGGYRENGRGQGARRAARRPPRAVTHRGDGHAGHAAASGRFCAATTAVTRSLCAAAAATRARCRAPGAAARPGRVRPRTRARLRHGPGWCRSRSRSRPRQAGRPQPRRNRLAGPKPTVIPADGQGSPLLRTAARTGRGSRGCRRWERR